MKVSVYSDLDKLYSDASNYFVDVLTTKENPVLGLATGSSPIGLYKNLVKEYEEGKISFKNVLSFNLDEYYGIGKTHPQSYHYFMNENLFKYVDINEENVHVPSGVGDIDSQIKEYEENIDKNPIDIQVLGVGRNGHIAFNEPGTSFDSITHVVELDEKTREDNARFFDSIDDVPTHAVTMGLKTIMKSKKIILIATGESKAWAVNQLVNGEISEDVPCTILQKHNDFVLLVDEDAASKLK